MTDIAGQAAGHPTDSGPIALADHGWFFAGGHFKETTDGGYFVNGMFVERFVPQERLHEIPIVMIHGGGQTGTNFSGTPDGRRGWLHDFLRAGYAVYVVDQPERGRSGHALDVDGAVEALGRSTVKRIEDRFVGIQDAMQWPKARYHTQWPGTGHAGDPVFDQFYASQVEGLKDSAITERLNLEAGVALLDAIGPAIVLTHSQSGPFGWLLADARPHLVTAILAVEPNGPPFRELAFHGGAAWYTYEEGLARPWGITRLPMTYDPPVADPQDLRPEIDPESGGVDLVTCYRQGGTPRRLKNLAGTPILIIASEASYHASYDHGTSRYLTQTGVENDFVRLEDVGLRGNGHMMMLERNNHDIADWMMGWLAKRVAV
jgi:pimeloyl-ACP methyl ester carboxylesterase